MGICIKKNTSELKLSYGLDTQGLISGRGRNFFSAEHAFKKEQDME